MKTIQVFLGGLCVCLITMSMASAQRSTTVSNFVGGIRIGGTATQISGDDLSGFHKLGAYTGLYAAFPLNDNENLKIQVEMNFAMKGSRDFTPPKQPANISSKYVLNLGYVEVPVLLRWRFARLTIRGSNDFEFELGPMFGVNIYARERDRYGIIQGRPEFTRFEFSVIGGLAYMLNEHHGFSFRYANSVWKVRKPNWAINRAIKMQYNSVLMLSYFYQF